MAQSQHPISPAIGNAVLILHMPDMQLDFDSENFLCSSAGKFDQERLEFFTNVIYPYWEKNRCTLHQLAEYLTQFDIELWTAADAQIDRKMVFAFEMRFRQQFAGTLIVQCELSRKEVVH